MTFPVDNPALRQALDARGYTDPTPVQLAILQSAASERDLLVSAQTGSGKTVAYGLAVATTLLGEAAAFARPAAPLALVIAPTRELALQVQIELSWLFEPASGRVLTCVGGMDARQEARRLEMGCHIVVGTPGRLADHLRRGNLHLDACRVVVLDEADEMLDLGFREELEFILDAAPADRRTLLFSATIAKEIATLARRYQRDALRIDTAGKNQAHQDIEYLALRIAPQEIEHGLVNVLRYHDARALVFCATREAVRRLHGKLLERGFAAVALSGELSQNERNSALQALRDGRASVCIATDVAARGLDLPDLDLVIHADLPTGRATLLHRSGRTGRAGRKGLSVMLVPPMKRHRLELLLNSAHINAQWGEPPTPDKVRDRDRERLLADPALVEPPMPEELDLAQSLASRFGPERLAVALTRVFMKQLPAPEDISPPPERAPVRRGPASSFVWFQTPIGRRQSADPKWLIPVLCRAGGISKQDIGAIRIFDRETKFEIAADAERRFAAAMEGAELQVTRAHPPGRSRAPEPAEPGPPKRRHMVKSPLKKPRPGRAGT